MPINGACVVAGIGVQTLSDWRKRDPGIEDGLNEAYECARQKALSEIKLAGEKDWRAHKAWLELTRPGDYRAGAKIDVTANAKVVSGIVLTVEDQRARYRSACDSYAKSKPRQLQPMIRDRTMTCLPVVKPRMITPELLVISVTLMQWAEPRK
jgi:hypothetical protein